MQRLSLLPNEVQHWLQSAADERWAERELGGAAEEDAAGEANPEASSSKKRGRPKHAQRSTAKQHATATPRMEPQVHRPCTGRPLLPVSNMLFSIMAARQDGSSQCRRQLVCCSLVASGSKA